MATEQMNLSARVRMSRQKAKASFFYVPAPRNLIKEISPRCAQQLGFQPISDAVKLIAKMSHHRVHPPFSMSSVAGNTQSLGNSFPSKEKHYFRSLLTQDIFILEVILSSHRELPSQFSSAPHKLRVTRDVRDVWE